ncbi:MAG: HEPN domain-containing protein [Alphaproteobacteria bacterium]|nr:HEPN domain-containing protein [Alphaproteobacteria bacterium]
MNETERHVADIRVILDAARAGGEMPADRLSSMAHRYLASSPEGRGRISPDVMAGLIGSELAGRFIHQGREADETQTTRMLAAALRRAAVDVEDRTHFIPCQLFEGGGPVGLAVGPVMFRRTESFRRIHADSFTAEPEFAALFESDFAPWDWTVEVTVRGCDRVISRERALKTVDGALDMLRLFAGADAAGNLGRAGARGLPAVTPAGLWADSGGRLHPVRAEGVAAVPNSGWLKRAHEPAGRDWLDRAGRCLDPLVDPALNWPLADRFREAASWFGEGVTETYRAARILAFVTAIERAVVPGDHADVWRAVTRRAAVLARDSEGGNLADWLDIARKIYEIRSQIVHGGLSPFAPEVGAMAPAGASIARAVLQGALAFYETLGLTHAEYSAERLEKDFRALEES